MLHPPAGLWSGEPFCRAALSSTPGREELPAATDERSLPRSAAPVRRGGARVPRTGDWHLESADVRVRTSVEIPGFQSVLARTRCGWPNAARAAGCLKPAERTPSITAVLARDRHGCAGGGPRTLCMWWLEPSRCSRTRCDVLVESDLAAVSLLSSSVVAERLGVLLGTVRRWRDLGYLEACRTRGGQRRFSARQVDGFIASLHEVARRSGAQRAERRSARTARTRGRFSRRTGHAGTRQRR